MVGQVTTNARTANMKAMVILLLLQADKLNHTTWSLYQPKNYNELFVNGSLPPPCLVETGLPLKIITNEHGSSYFETICTIVHNNKLKGTSQKKMCNLTPLFTPLIRLLSKSSCMRLCICSSFRIGKSSLILNLSLNTIMNSMLSYSL